jgi:hypothetical protein
VSDASSCSRASTSASLHGDHGLAVERLGLGLARDEDVSPVVPRTVVHEHIDTVSLFNFEPRREGLESALGRPSLTRDEHAIAFGQNGRFVRLVVPPR